jgi:hypothetical protein
MPSEMSAVERVFQVFITCGAKDAVVQSAAAKPRIVSLSIFFGRLFWLRREFRMVAGALSALRFGSSQCSVATFG